MSFQTTVVVGDFEGYLHWFDSATGELQARVRAGFENLQWYGPGPEESYIDRNELRVGVYRTTVEDNYFEYSQPQETGNKVDVRWAALTSADGVGLLAAGLAANLTVNPLEAVTTVTVQIVTLLVGDQEFDSPKTLAAFALGLVLFLVGRRQLRAERDVTRIPWVSPSLKSIAGMFLATPITAGVKIVFERIEATRPPTA